MFDNSKFSDFLKHQVFIAFDTETTGMWAPINRIVEIGAIKFTLNHGEIASFDRLVNPEKEIPDDVIQVHGITNEDVKDAPTIKPVLDEFMQFCEPGAIMIAHNAPFDISFVAGELKRHDMEFGRNMIIDTIEIYKKYFPDLASYSLLNLVKRFGISSSQDHRALSDARFVYILFRKAAEIFHNIDSIDGFRKEISHYHMDEIVDENLKLPNEHSDLDFAIENNLRVEIEYQHPMRGSHLRVISPKEVHKLGTIFYIIAHCEMTGAERTFRLDRINQYKVLAGM